MNDAARNTIIVSNLKSSPLKTTLFVTIAFLQGRKTFLSSTLIDPLAATLSGQRQGHGSRVMT